MHEAAAQGHLATVQLLASASSAAEAVEEWREE